MRTLALLTAIYLCVSCQLAGPRPETTQLKDDLFSAAGVADPLPTDKLRRHPFTDCGHEKGKIQLFRIDEDLYPPQWLDESIWRGYARPKADGASCRSAEYTREDSDYCWRHYGLQYYHAQDYSSGNERWLVNNISPVIRIIPRDEYPHHDSWCRFDNDTALIWVAGVNNRNLGSRWSQTDSILLASIMAWNQNRDYPAAVEAASQNEPAGHGKLATYPGYVQIVQNRNLPVQGAWGRHSEPDIETMSRNFELAYRAGIRHLEVVTHSNGMVTAHIAYAEFAKRLLRNAQWTSERMESTISRAMTVKMYHTQAAPSQRWSQSELNTMGYYSDFIPVAKWVGRMPWSWEWDFKSYIQDLEEMVNLEIRYYYNRPDAMTWDDGLWHMGMSTVGRRESLYWQKDIDKNRSEYGITTPIYHFVCTANDVDVCGPSHKQRDVLWDFTNPAMTGTGRPIRWQFARMGRAGQNLGLLDEETAANEVLVSADTRDLPHTICLRSDNALCRREMARYAPEDELERLLAAPNMICGNEAAGADLCQTSECGDGICNYAANEQCEEDCATPGSYKICMCTPAGCSTYHAKCPGGVCDIQRAMLPAGRTCSCPGSPTACTTSNTNCHVIEENNGCRISDVDPIGPGLYRITQCERGECRVELPSAERTANPETEDKEITP